MCGDDFCPGTEALEQEREQLEERRRYRFVSVLLSRLEDLERSEATLRRVEGFAAELLASDGKISNLMGRHLSAAIADEPPPNARRLETVAPDQTENDEWRELDQRQRFRDAGGNPR